MCNYDDDRAVDNDDDADNDNTNSSSTENNHNNENSDKDRVYEYEIEARKEYLTRTWFIDLKFEMHESWIDGAHGKCLTLLH